MSKGKFGLGSVFILVTYFVFGCASVDYVGKSFNPTTSIDTYFSEDEKEREYTIIGYAIGSGVWVSSEKIQAKLIKEAKIRGADAVLITGIGRESVDILGEGSSESESQINASFLKYK